MILEKEGKVKWDMDSKWDMDRRADREEYVLYSDLIRNVLAIFAKEKSGPLRWYAS